MITKYEIRFNFHTNRWFVLEHKQVEGVVFKTHIDSYKDLNKAWEVARDLMFENHASKVVIKYNG